MKDVYVLLSSLFAVVPFDPKSKSLMLCFQCLCESSFGALIFIIEFWGMVLFD